MSLWLSLPETIKNQREEFSGEMDVNEVNEEKSSSISTVQIFFKEFSSLNKKATISVVAGIHLFLCSSGTTYL